MTIPRKWLRGLATIFVYYFRQTSSKPDYPRPKMITPIFVFMAFSLLLAGATMLLEVRKSDNSDEQVVAAYKNKLNKISGLINGKLLHFLSSDSEDEYAEKFAEKWKIEIQDAKDKGLID